MHLDLLLHTNLDDQFKALADQMQTWEHQQVLGEDSTEALLSRVCFFGHTVELKPPKVYGAVKASGMYPVLAYDETYVYFTTAKQVRFGSGSEHPYEVDPEISPFVDLCWIDLDLANRSVLDTAFARLAGHPVSEVVEASDYRQLKAQYSKYQASTKQLLSGLIRPSGNDAGNLGIQLRSTAELGAALRLIDLLGPGDLLLYEGTLSLPMVGRAQDSLFSEHLKRLCLVRAREKNLNFIALSQQPGIPGLHYLEQLINSYAGREVAEHWYLRLPVPGIDEWPFPLSAGRTVPPPGVVTYLVRFHKQSPLLRVDLDRAYWDEHMNTGEDGRPEEASLFQALDYICHDMRSYGYPYPLHAARSRIVLGRKEQEVLQRRLVEEALRRGIPRQRLRLHHR